LSPRTDVKRKPDVNNTTSISSNDNIVAIKIISGISTGGKGRHCLLVQPISAWGLCCLRISLFIISTHSSLEQPAGGRTGIHIAAVVHLNTFQPGTACRRTYEHPHRCSCSPQHIPAWNSLPEDIRASTSLQLFTSTHSSLEQPARGRTSIHIASAIHLNTFQPVTACRRTYAHPHRCSCSDVGSSLSFFGVLWAQDTPRDFYLAVW